MVQLDRPTKVKTRQEVIEELIQHEVVCLLSSRGAIEKAVRKGLIGIQSRHSLWLKRQYQQAFHCRLEWKEGEF